jgi:DNA (cytosine-5)-methyltransferase 1
MQWENLFHCEWNEFGQKVLKHYWPNAISYEDITKTDFSIHRGDIDILTGGFPCQPYSTAGKRLGKEDDRHLWPEMLRAIREIQPTYVVGENVLGLVNWNGGLVFDEVQADLEAEGYEVQPFVLPAASVNAPHRRDRVWFVAYATSERNPSPRKSGEIKRNRGEGASREKKRGVGSQRVNRLSRLERNAPNVNSRRLERTKKKRRHSLNAKRKSELRFITNANNERLQGGENRRVIKRSREERKEQPSRFIQSAWEVFPTQSPICGGNDGLPTELDGITFPKCRNESIKAFGNAIVPQVALQIFKAIQAYETTRKEM